MVGWCNRAIVTMFSQMRGDLTQKLTCERHCQGMGKAGMNEMVFKGKMARNESTLCQMGGVLVNRNALQFVRSDCGN